MVILDRVANVPVAFAKSFGKGMRVVGGIVENLDLQQLLRVLDFDHFVDQPLKNVAFVIKRKLNGDRQQRLESLRGVETAFLRCLKYARIISKRCRP